ncbi:putative aryl hydrocarbon receptor nuclear translocator-like protein 2 [Rhexocercosporidium sp. MPI-PUGE-AT-0058]|nr:putative aryl hydrocarbon receptor nuclear translocator-like protein 2 [Rhexocercosporidium sp. MPI-PUGE-AT-0058]
METTFMTIHNLSREANILFASESIIDILGFLPEEVIGRSSFDYFHPDEVFNARTIHNRGVQMDRAAVLHYARIQNRAGEWVGCECVFTIVYEVLVACTSIYRGDLKSARRAVEAPVIRRLFASSPRDPRYHMLEHLSSKFRAPPQASLLEPRAALILNRFTRTLTVMYATNAVSEILGISPEEFKDKSFYECMQENCLPEAIRCLESAKANDSIAYLRFWHRNPRREEEADEEMREASQSSDSEDGGVELHGHMDIDSSPVAEKASGAVVPETSGNGESSGMAASHSPMDSSRTSSGASTDLEHDATHAIFDKEQTSRSSTSSLTLVSPGERLQRRNARSPRPAPAPEPIEIEAVVSCTSDGLVVVLRRARPFIPSLQQPVQQAQIPQYANGLFAAPWGANPIRPHLHQPDAQFPFQHGLQAPQIPVGGPPLAEFMNSIREVAVFAWSLTGINGNIASYGHGIPRGESQPPGGLPIWDPYAQPSPGYLPPDNQAAEKWSRLAEKTNQPGDGNRVPFEHLRQQQLLERHGCGNDLSMGPSHSGAMLDRPAPAYTFEPQPGHSPGHISWEKVPSQTKEEPPTTQPPNPSGPREATFETPNQWH